MRRRITVTLLSLLCCVSLAGCDFVNKVNETVRSTTSGIATNSVISGISRDNKFAMTQDTKDKQSVLLDAANAYDEAASKKAEDTPPKSWGFVGGILDWGAGLVGQDAASRNAKSTQKAKLKMEQAQNSYESAKATDNAFLVAKGQQGEQDINTYTKIIKYVVIVAIIIIVLLLLFKLLKNRAPKQKPVAARATVPANTSVPSNTQWGGHAEEATRNICAKKGLDADEQFRKYGSWEAAFKAIRWGEISTP